MQLAAPRRDDDPARRRRVRRRCRWRWRRRRWQRRRRGRRCDGVDRRRRNRRRWARRRRGDVLPGGGGGRDCSRGGRRGRGAVRRVHRQQRAARRRRQPQRDLSRNSRLRAGGARDAARLTEHQGSMGVAQRHENGQVEWPLRRGRRWTARPRDDGASRRLVHACGIRERGASAEERARGPARESASAPEVALGEVVGERSASGVAARAHAAARRDRVAARRASCAFILASSMQCV